MDVTLRPLSPLASWRTAWLVAAMVLVSGCSSLPKLTPEEREPKAAQAIPLSADTLLGRIATDSQPSKELSGFRLMPLGLFSLDTRVQLAKRAQVSLDVQYYDFEDDETGRYFIRALADAALRGVRVRLLIDDFYTSGKDDFFLGFATLPNVEVRLFNPFTVARDSGQLTRFVAGYNEFTRLNHRMHNKLFIADGAMAVIGGRNMANEYFLRSMSENFIDVDAFTVGQVIPPLQNLFDRYWNGPPVWPLASVAKSSLTKEQLRAKFDRDTSPEHTPAPPPLPPNDVLGYGPLVEDLEGGRLGLIWCEAYVFADYPDKPFEDQSNGELLETSVTYNVFEAIKQAKSEVVAVSPYFVPGERGMNFLKDLRDRGISISVLTNSLASTDEPAVYLGYTRYREPMLKMGIDLYELSSSRVKENKRMFLFGSALGRLHAKLVVIDRKRIFVGSMNLDPRSATINTELGAVIDSPQLAKELLRVIDIDRLQSAYRVRLRKDGSGVEWYAVDGDQERVLETEPDASEWLKFKKWLLTPFVPEELL
ncbi:MAG TPA: phospholipase D family protein [Caldimonas sp.]|nr:phospholipase D family protein [Caldimonas sp.]